MPLPPLLQPLLDQPLEPPELLVLLVDFEPPVTALTALDTALETAEQKLLTAFDALEKNPPRLKATTGWAKTATASASTTTAQTIRLASMSLYCSYTRIYAQIVSWRSSADMSRGAAAADAGKTAQSCANRRADKNHRPAGGDRDTTPVRARVTAYPELTALACG